MSSTDRASHWSLTINNPTAVEHEQIALARQKGWKVSGQEEVGKEGTPHLQLHLTTPQVRFSAVKKHFPRAHIQVARNPIALEAYVNKEETRTSALPSPQAMYPSLSKFWHLVYEICNERNWLDWSTDRIEMWWREAYFDLGVQRPSPAVEAQREFAMLVLDSCVEKLIYDGYHVDMFYSPPNMNLWKKFHFAILQRSAREISEQTARQTDARSDSGDSSPGVVHTPDAVSEVNIPQTPSPPASP